MMMTNPNSTGEVIPEKADSASKLALEGLKNTAQATEGSSQRRPGGQEPVPSSGEPTP